MLKMLLQASWPYLLFAAIMALAAWLTHRHNRDAARKGENPRSIRFSFGHNSFRKDPEQPYTGDRKINRHWKP